ncbi:MULTISPECIES: hypothetical protein [Sorangium]|uniref:hypothetical protein n=1 Tax=Sorangium TaxID=39643 RepID=UPI0013EBB044|nr:MULTISPECIES: hypothetical protein [Sorangium]
MPHFRVALEDISAGTDEALRARATAALTRVVLRCFRYARHPRSRSRAHRA